MKNAPPSPHKEKRYIFSLLSVAKGWRLNSMQMKLKILTVSISTISRTFDSLFRVLFIVPSRYLFAIGFLQIFSFRWDLPPNFGCILKQPDSKKNQHTSQILLPRREELSDMISTTVSIWIFNLDYHPL